MNILVLSGVTELDPKKNNWEKEGQNQGTRLQGHSGWSNLLLLVKGTILHTVEKDGRKRDF